MFSSTASRSTPSLTNLSISNGSNTIDLTGDDEDRYDYPRELKRMRIDNITHPTPTPTPPQQASSSTMSTFTSFNQKPAMAMPMAPSIFVPQPVHHNGGHHTPSAYRPAFAGPLPPSTPHNTAQQATRNIIDLTSSPSPPPQELPPKTPVCIGMLSVTALVLYPVPYILPMHPGSPLPEFATVKLQYDHSPDKPAGTSPNSIHIKTPTNEPFAVVEQKVADHIGHMIGKGLIRLEAKVRKGPPNLPILPLYALVHTPKGNVPVVGRYLEQCGLLLDHPSIPFDFADLVASKTPYMNPHNPPPGGHNRMNLVRNPNVYPNQASRWTTPQVAGKSVEVQRSQVDELFKNLKTGAELPETEASPEVATKLYPHQKRAVTFLLDRERERPIGTTFSSLWQRRIVSGMTSWVHLVTQKEVYEEPIDSKGAILADDMGLGKTITCVSLIAATIRSAAQFASSSVDRPTGPLASSSREDPSVSHFAGSAWGMPPVENNAKAKAKAQRAQERLESEQLRASRIKAKSRATLIICPLSTVSNWEDQFREHWRGEVNVVGGSTSQSSPRTREGRPLRVYIYHGNARRPDPDFLADFDAVITTYATLASEFSKQNRSVACADDDDDECAVSSDGGGVEIDERGNQVLRLPKPKRAGQKRKKSGLGGSSMEATSALQSIHWFRVVLDEAHCIKETGTVGSRASCDLMADRRLCLTGTPVQNKLDDVFALVKFLRIDPLDDKTVWTEYIGAPVKFGQTLGIARLQTLMSTITLRRTKESKTEDGKRILSLPPRRDELRYLKFDPQEQQIYDQFFSASKAEFNEMSDKNEVMKNYVGILQKILRLRQICDHFELVEGKDGFGQEVLSYDDMAAAIEKEGFTVPRAVAIWSILREAATTQCVECGCELCFSTDGAQAEEEVGEGPKRAKKAKAASSSKAPTRASSPSTPTPVMTRCQHLFCIGCFRQCVLPDWPNLPPNLYRSCSACQTGISLADAIEIKPEYLESSKKKTGKRERRQKGSGMNVDIHPSTKVKALLGDLLVSSRANKHSANYDPSADEVQMVDENGQGVDEGGVKTVVFSQWTTMLDKIEDALEASGIRYDRLDGTMKRDDRIRAMDALKHDPSCEVLLVSLKAGGVGLNLTAAQRVYLMDPYWNPAVENQAVDRIHRLGQTRPVTTVKLIIENSIEARLLEVQKKKTELANMTLGHNYSKQELMARRLEELSQLFGE